MFGHGGDRGSRLRAAFDACPDPIVLLEPVRDDEDVIVDFVYSEANAVACEHNRKPYNVLIGMRLLSLLPAQRDAGFLQHYVRVMESGQPLSLRDHVYDEDPNSLQAQHYDTYMAPCDGGVLVTWRDVTQRHWAEQALLRTNEKLRLARESEESAKQNASDYLRMAKHFKMLAENASDVVYETNLDGAIQWISPSVEAALGYGPEQLIGVKALELVLEEDRVIAAEPRRSVYAEGLVAAVQVRFPTTDGDVRWMAVSARPLRGEGEEIRGAVVGLHDVTAERRIAHLLETSERTFRNAMDAAPHGMAIADTNDRITQANPALADLLGTTMGELIGGKIARFVVRPDPVMPTCAERIMASGEDRILHHRHQVLSEHGVDVIEHSVSLVRDKNGAPQFFVHQLTDASELHALEEGLREQANHDLLTGVLNRGGLLQRIEEWEQVAPGSASHLALLFCDVDGLKHINDAYGHAVGDIVLKTAAARIVASVRRSDLVSRIGGDEFIVAMDRILSTDIALDIAEKVRLAVDAPVMYNGTALDLRISIGVAVSEGVEELDSLTSRADAALHRAKRSGRNCVRI